MCVLSIVYSLFELTYVTNRKWFCQFSQIAAEVSAPLAKTDEIVLLGDDRTTAEVSRLVTNLPPAVQALTGVDLSRVIFTFYST